MFKNGLHDSRNGPSSGTDDVALHLTHQVFRRPDSRHISQTSGKKPADPIETEDIRRPMPPGSTECKIAKRSVNSRKQTPDRFSPADFFQTAGGKHSQHQKSGEEGGHMTHVDLANGIVGQIEEKIDIFKPIPDPLQSGIRKAHGHPEKSNRIRKQPVKLGTEKSRPQRGHPISRDSGNQKAE